MLITRHGQQAARRTGAIPVRDVQYRTCSNSTRAEKGYNTEKAECLLGLFELTLATSAALQIHAFFQ